MVIKVGVEPDKAKARRERQGAMIRKLREIHSYAIADFAEELGVTPGAVSQWECGRYTPRAEHQVAIARLLQVPHSAIFGMDIEAAAS